MKTQQDVRAGYEGFFKFAEAVGDSGYTSAVMRQLHILITNPGIEGTERVREIFRGTGDIDLEYQRKFRYLLVTQERLEAQVQR